jgi:hypothetical protein
LHEAAEPGVLHEVSGRAEIESPHRILVGLEHGHHDDLGRAACVLDIADEVVAQAIAEIEVDQHHVEIVFAHEAASLPQRVGLCDDDGPLVAHELLRHHPPRVGIVIDHRDTHRPPFLSRQEVGPDRWRALMGGEVKLALRCRGRHRKLDLRCCCEHNASFVCALGCGSEYRQMTHAAKRNCSTLGTKLRPYPVLTTAKWACVGAASLVSASCFAPAANAVGTKYLTERE